MIDGVKIVKLISGEELIAHIIDMNHDGIVGEEFLVKKPVTISGNFMAVKPWLNHSKECVFKLHISKILCIAEPTEQVINIYRNAIE